MKQNYNFLYSFYDENNKLVGVVNNHITEEEKEKIKKEKKLDYIIYEGEDNGK